MAQTLAQALAAACRAGGVRRAFGVPGGASSLDVIDAFAAEDIDFVLTHGETAATLMAAVTAELGGAPGVAVTGVGPGAASAVNGVAYAALERAPVLLVTDALAEPAPGHHALHQRFDQKRPLRTTGQGLRETGEPSGGLGEIDLLLDTAAAHPAGPVQLDLTTAAASAPAEPAPGKRRAAKTADKSYDLVTLAEARGLLAASARPLIVAGMEARGRAASAALRVLAQALGCPVMTTYKAKGAIADADRLAVGCFTGASADARCLDRADLLIFFGLDPVELLPGPWRFEGRILALAAHDGYDYPAVPTAALTGALDRSAVALMENARPASWSELEIAALRSRLRAGLAMTGPGGRTAEEVVTAVRRVAPAGARITVDSGAHMFSAMGLWQADRAQRRAEVERPLHNGLCAAGGDRRSAGGAGAPGDRHDRRRWPAHVLGGACDGGASRLPHRGRGVQRFQALPHRHQAAAAAAGEPGRALRGDGPCRRRAGSRMPVLARGRDRAADPGARASVRAATGRHWST